MVWQEIISNIQKHHSFIITAHVNPDCDALGSELALAEHLKRLGKQVTIINSDPTPEAYRFLDPKRLIKRYTPARHLRLINQAQVIIVLDTSGGWQRIGPAGEVMATTQALKICIDHHPDSTNFVDLAVVDTEAAATAELIYELVMAMQGNLSPNMAQALYAALMTDTGSFRYPKTSPRTHQITATLLSTGANPLYIYNQIYEQYSLNRVRLKGRVLDSIRTEANGKIAYYSLDQKTLKAYGIKVAELDGFASLGQEIGGAQVTIFCVESSKSKVKISLRSDGCYAINQIAAEYGGGGHTSAAGATVSGDLEEVMAEVVAKTKRLLAKNPRTHEADNERCG